MRLKKVLIGIPLAIVGLLFMAALTAVAWISVLDRASGEIVVGGETREYLLHVPTGYDPGVPTPLVVSLHAGATWPAHQKNLTRWNWLADERGFLVVYPAGTPQLPGVVRIWRTTPDGAKKDARFLSALIDTLEASYTIDPGRIYLNGMSNGGGMTLAASCLLSDRIAAFGVVAAANDFPAEACEDPRPAPLIAFHGDADPIVPYVGGRLNDPLNPVKPIYPPVRDWVAAWARRDGCVENPVEANVAKDVVRLEYPRCADGTAVLLYTLQGGGHSWPGGKPPPEWRVGATNASIDATREMWEFFQAHSR